MMLYAVAIVLVHAVLAVQGRGSFHLSRPANDIESLCAGKRVALLTISELQYLNTIVSGSRCPSNVKAAIPDLFDLIEQTKDNVCAQESIDKMRNFYVKYLDTSAEQNKHREELPRSLKKFALAYGMQMSSACKKFMVDVLTYEGRDILFAEANEAIKNLVSDTSPVSAMLGSLAGPDEILLPGDLAPYIREKRAEDNIIHVQSATGPYIRGLQAKCNYKFASFYKPLIRPIVQLVNMGFNYKNAPLRSDMGNFATSKELSKWSRLVFLCESLNNIRMVDVPQQAGVEDAEAKNVRILTKEEAAAIDDKSESEPEIHETKYRAVILPNELIVNEKDRKLKNALRAFCTNKSVDEKIAKRVMGKGVAMFRAQLKRYSIGLFFSKGYKAIVHRIRNGEKLKPNEEIVKVLDGAIGHESEYHDSLLDEISEISKRIALSGLLVVAHVVMGILFIAFILSFSWFFVLDGWLNKGELTEAICEWLD